MMDKRAQIRRAKALVIQKSQEDFFGEVIFKFEKGNVVHIQVSENVKPPTRDEFHQHLDAFFDAVEQDTNTEYRIRKIKGQPHVTTMTSGGIERVIPISTIEEAEKYRTGV
jgi:hypothetical protein